MIVVAAAYRLGVFGFLDLGIELEDAPYNAAMLGEWPRSSGGLLDDRLPSDILAALRWSHENLGMIGGDVARITAFGYSRFYGKIVSI